MKTIPRKHVEDLDLHALRVLDVLFRERSLTRAAEALHTQQPALSKTLARLRRYFGDPLFVRVALHMEPTAKALELIEPVRAVLDGLQRLRNEQTRFDPARSTRVFRVFTLDAGVIVMLPAIMKKLLETAPGVRLRAAQVDLQSLNASLESGNIDLGIGEFPLLIPGIRRQKLFSGRHMCIFQKDHPRLSRNPSLAAFLDEQHIFITAAGTGHPHQIAERTLEDQLPAKNIIAHVPTFTAAAILAKNTNAVATMPGPVASVLARELDMQLAKPPIKLPEFEIAQYWHERFDRDPGNQWLRSIVHSQFGGGKSPARG
ncbi:LysR family transcriptional regulator [Bradyrhizobium sp. Tv2a-2]|uniref:LysR family transcriptional regulator n=1 Tax=Bradyrhizobium sp. Tv2a-2 TaxID=113395 RepID=UPI0004157C2F|nr:LysR family transcriptional regulator [Bradyrhizobium sp. Tv2a-2]